MNKGLITSLKGSAKRILRTAVQPRPESTIHFLHIGKNAGSNIGATLDAIKRANGRVSFQKLGHSKRLKDIPEKVPYFFSLRSPVTRFRSGFYSRKRMGQPLYNVPWSACEVLTFQQFTDANDLAEALFSPGQLGRDATAAILSISHTSMSQVSWFERWGHTLTVRPPVWIIRQENYPADMREFLRRIDCSEVTTASQDPHARHENDYSDVPNFSQRAIENLHRWYCQDFAFYDLCEDWLEKHQNGSGESPAI